MIDILMTIFTVFICCLIPLVNKWMDWCIQAMEYEAKGKKFHVMDA